jgi:aromatic-L-amino-acid decarboxylase
VATPLDPNEATLREWVQTALERALAHLAAAPGDRVQHTEGGAALAAALRHPTVGDEGVPLETVLDTVFNEALSVTYNTASGGYLAYVPGGGLPASAVADLVTALVNRYTTVWVAAPGLVEIEQNAVRWLLDLVGWGPRAGDDEGEGLLLSGGSMANFTAVHTARATKLKDRPTDGVLYTSSEAHHSVFKAAMLAGFRHEDVRALPLDEHLQLQPDVLRAAVEEDKRAGRRPFMVLANAGSTNTGTVDPLGPLAEVCAAHDLWLHVDGAYGAPFLLTDRGREALTGIERADSITLDPHKGLFLPFGTGALLVRRPGLLRAAHEVPGAYMPPMQDDRRHVDYAAMGPELTREWRGLRVWLPLKLHGRRAFEAALDERLDLARQAAARVAALEDVVLHSPPALSLFSFRLEPPGVTGAALDALNKAWLERTCARGRVFLTGTQLARGFVCRMCVLHLRTDAERVEAALEDLAAARDEVLAEAEAA